MTQPSTPSSPVSIRDQLYEQAFKQLIDFHELDVQLSSDQRLTLALFYRKQSIANILFLYLGFLPGLALPFVLQYRKTGSTKGVKFGKSVFWGMGGMIVMPQILSPIYFNSKFEELKLQKGNESKEVKVVELLPLIKAVVWSGYFLATSKDPQLILKDPRVLRAEQEQGSNVQRKPGFIANGDLLGIKNGTQYGGIPQDNEMDKKSSAWDPVRQGNYNDYDPQERSSSAFAQETNDDIFEVDFDESNSKDSRGEGFGQRSTSAWDRVRHQSISGRGNIIGTPRPSNSYSYQSPTKSEQDEFDELIEKERNAQD